MSSVNKCILIGRLGQDPTMRYTKAGEGVCNFSLATSENWKDKAGEKQERTTWHNIVIWGKVAEIATEYLNKGKQVYIEGRLQTRDWEDKDGNKRQTTEIIASTMTMLGQREGGQGQDQGQAQGSKRTNLECPRCKKSPCVCEGAGGGDSFEDEDIPF